MYNCSIAKGLALGLPLQEERLVVSLGIAESTGRAANQPSQNGQELSLGQFTHSPFSFERMSLVPLSPPPSSLAVSPERFNIQGELIGLEVQEFLPLPFLFQSATSSLYLDGTCLNIL